MRVATRAVSAARVRATAGSERVAVATSPRAVPATGRAVNVPPVTARTPPGIRTSVCPAPSHTAIDETAAPRLVTVNVTSAERLRFTATRPAPPAGASTVNVVMRGGVLSTTRGAGVRGVGLAGFEGAPGVIA
jgi:hypothetical protein